MHEHYGLEILDQNTGKTPALLDPESFAHKFSSISDNSTFDFYASFGKPQNCSSENTESATATRTSNASQDLLQNPTF